MNTVDASMGVRKMNFFLLLAGVKTSAFTVEVPHRSQCTT